MKLSDFDYDLPQELIAQEPVEPRDHSRLMILDVRSQKITHDHFYNLPKYLKTDDLLVFNQSKVFPARLYGKKATGGKVEVLLISANGNSWEYISKPGLKGGQTVNFGPISGQIENERLNFNTDIRPYLDEIGHTPLPPYISSEHIARSTKDIRSRYQTVYAKDEGSVAAPTAGFHFTPELLEKIPNKAFVTLHVGLGTFVSVKSEQIENHIMHSERFSISIDARSQILDARRVIAVGTTSARVLESDWDKPETSIFIYPGYKFQHVDGLITNFHLPKSTLLMLVSAFAGRDLIMRAYQEAIREKYRFYSFGDAMLIL